MSKIDFEIANKMRAEGASYDEIGKRFGVTKQRACAYFNSSRFDGRRKRKGSKVYEEIIYKGLSEWVNSNDKITISSLSHLIFGKGGKAERAQVNNLLSGKNVKLSIPQIARLVSASGMSFEQLFELDEQA